MQARPRRCVDVYSGTRGVIGCYAQHHTKKARFCTWCLAQVRPCGCSSPSTAEIPQQVACTPVKIRSEAMVIMPTNADVPSTDFRSAHVRSELAVLDASIWRRVDSSNVRRWFVGGGSDMSRGHQQAVGNNLQDANCQYACECETSAVETVVCKFQRTAVDVWRRMTPGIGTADNVFVLPRTGR